MMKISLFFVSFWFVSTSLGASLEFARDYQAVHDLDGFRFEQIIPRVGQPWVVMKIKPGPFSGGLSEAGARMNPKTDKIEVLSNATASLWVEEASAKVLATLVGIPPQQEYDIYRAYKPEFHRFGPFNSADGWYRPFQQGGVAVCCVHENLADKDPAKFSPLYLIPEDWGSLVKDAFEYFKANRDLFDPKGVVTNRDRLEKLLLGDNPLLAAVACRVLAEARQLNQDLFIENDLKVAKGFRQAVFVRYVLKSTTPEEAGKVSAAMERTIDQVGSMQQLRPLVLGATYAASEAKNPEVKHACSRILQRLEEKYAKLASAEAADEYILTAFQTAGVTPAR